VNLNKTLSSKTILLVGLGFSILIYFLDGTIGFPLLFLVLAIIAFAREQKIKKNPELAVEENKEVSKKSLYALITLLLILVALVIFAIVSLN
jgi:ABC-type antimicrobial peptide transport system permease subunit